jgi:small-conductance mechanosensitive channel
MADSRKKSASEAFINSFGSFPLGYLVGIGILPLMVEWIQNDPLTANIVITAIFALVSFVRTYVLRRIFDKYGFNDNLASLLSKLVYKLKQRKEKNEIEC